MDYTVKMSIFGDLIIIVTVLSLILELSRYHDKLRLAVYLKYNNSLIEVK